MEYEPIRARALELFAAGYNCSQATFAALAPSLGMDEATALKTAASFGGGIARSGGVCGALTGALLALGLKRGQCDISPEIKNAMYLRAGALMDAFAKGRPSADCRDLIGCDLSTAEGRAAALSRDVHKTVCRDLVAEAVRLVIEER
ncbi:MAG: hypothetical protein A2Z99_12180 [Treponema sp. GWB1_62_6]|nr:MAG: hypothetical protein A2001_06540 [Treponema sp. GWC1_61_84]OHE64218.1 MAG: hypothetical protein A2Y36_08045 [Treponema sp. GWA1_62_8]OHE64378.1 MAG: hypothetical protein A2Z99_12180 [Treponema sp. GWB1_62_6]OHE76278.1 MAG: hypothetical protein A2413_02865 [Treponema sp. RIFOXYC1_FULL_61_9]HCM28818.1 hypothetical protein [Treponema sp.]